jgi:hypothetical protein
MHSHCRRSPGPAPDPCPAGDPVEDGPLPGEIVPAQAAIEKTKRRSQAERFGQAAERMISRANMTSSRGEKAHGGAEAA